MTAAWLISALIFTAVVGTYVIEMALKLALVALYVAGIALGATVWLAVLAWQWARRQFQAMLAARPPPLADITPLGCPRERSGDACRDADTSRDQAGAPPPLRRVRTEDELQRELLNRLDPPAQRLLELALEKYPHEVTVTNALGRAKLSEEELSLHLLELQRKRLIERVTPRRFVAGSACFNTSQPSGSGLAAGH